MGVLIGLGAGIIVATIAVTIVRYDDLPDRIPIHFGLDGTPNAYGPRPAIWLIPSVELLVAALAALTYAGQIAHLTLVVINAVLVSCFAAQLLIISAATSGAQRVEMRGFWVVFAATMAVALAAAFGRIG